MPTFNSDTITTIGILYGIALIIAIWLGMTFWTYRDIRTRSRDSMTRTLATGTVAILTIPGFILYLFLRPKETLAEAYERSLEEEALLQEIEEKPTCPGCGQRTESSWQLCPNCHTRLKKPCINCGQLLELPWKICPHCTTNQGHYDEALSQTAAPSRVSLQRQNRQTRSEERAYPQDTLDYIEGDDYQ